MITIRTSAEITVDRQVVLNLPPETPIGRAELVVTVSPQNQTSSPQGSLRKRFGAIHSGNGHSADNERIDADLARSYAHEQDE